VDAARAWNGSAVGVCFDVGDIIVAIAEDDGEDIWRVVWFGVLHGASTHALAQGTCVVRGAAHLA